ncbi:hypothetical protein JB92DRAFT_3002743 [Gautieria morchelliformis]|nr:hypothetical protein JB92DRAFT_3002743 [Gautieria morchelliformis]
MPGKAYYLEFPRTDGSSTKWPLDKLDPTPVDNEVNFMRPIGREEALSLKWRTQIGQEVAKLLGHSDYNSYILKDFPEGYRFYHHNKGSVNEPRTDPYLYGAPSGRYRSPPEFIRHAYWLITDDTLNRQNCKCKYCGSSKQKQMEISQSLGIRSAATHNPNTIAPSTKPKVRLVAQPRKRGLSGNMLNPDRNSDLRASRRFRVAELVWCALSPPIQGEHEDERIEFWPGLVNEARLKSDVLPHEPGKAWRVVQSNVYKVKLLGIKHSYVLPETAALPYQAYGPSLGLIERLRNSGNPSLLQDRQRLSEFHPIPLGIEVESGPQAPFVDASTPFALAIQIAAHLVRMWTPTDEWKFHGEVRKASATTNTAPTAVERNETRHLGLWWGAERIWTDELVRLQPARAQVMPQGSPLIKRASPRSDARGLLMRINSIIALPEGVPKDYPRHCKVAGALYELADEAYEEEEPSEAPPAESYVSSGVAPAASLVIPGQMASTSSATMMDPSQTFKNGDDPGTDATPAEITPQRQSSDPPINANPYSFSLPKPPDGYKFRPILKTGSEIMLDVSLISGRYYPELLKHPLLENTVADANPNDARVSQLTALCGLLPGAVNSMECVDWASTRLGMIQHADETAQEDLFQHWHPPDVAMEVVNDDEGG